MATQTASVPFYAYSTIQPTDYHLGKKVLSLLTLYVLSSNKSIRRSHLMNVSTLINTYDPKGYENDPEKKEMIEFIRKGLDARLNYNLTDPQLILYHINGNITDDIDASQFMELNASDIEWLNKMVSETISQAHVYVETNRMIDICNRFQTATLGAEKAAVAKEFQEEVTNVQNKFRQVKNESAEDEIFSLQPGIFENVMRSTYDELSNPSRKLLLGNQALNELFGGGLEETRVYTILGLPGEGKSFSLLDIAYMVKKYNKTVKTKDPTKRPCVVILTMENRIAESISRLFNMSIKKNTRMTEYELDDVMRQMREEGKLVVNDEDPIDIIIKFKPAFSVDTSYMYTLTEDLEDMGLECICFIQDYIGRINSTSKLSETRLEYGKIVDDMKVFASLKQIPVVTAGQLNRDASKHIDESRKKNKSDLVRTLGRSNVSESVLILNNSDGVYIIAPEEPVRGEKWIGWQRVKKRFETTDQDYYYIPCYPGTMAMVEDIGAAPVSRTTMRPENAMDGMIDSMVTKYNANPIRDIADFESDDMFMPSGTMVSSNGSYMNVYSELADDAVAMMQYWLNNRLSLEQAHAKMNNGLYCPIVYSPIVFD